MEVYLGWSEDNQRRGDRDGVDNGGGRKEREEGGFELHSGRCKVKG